ncbi:hypothetical protein [Burkholderia mayonis]|uniref:hypothetical protein n=1 Tax=Burkholderia mayonis TaxID=1385591 RepID=UPI00131F08F2|nr:hypothetical protein [Burkholderia mayonis]
MSWGNDADFAHGGVRESFAGNAVLRACRAKSARTRSAAMQSMMRRARALGARKKSGPKAASKLADIPSNGRKHATVYKQCSETPHADSDDFVQISVLGGCLPHAAIRATAAERGAERDWPPLCVERRAHKIDYHRMSGGHRARPRNTVGDRKEESC